MRCIYVVVLVAGTVLLFGEALFVYLKLLRCAYPTAPLVKSSVQASMNHEHLITQFILYYQALVALNYISPSDIHLPPTPVKIDAVRDAGLSPEAVSVLQRLPQLSPNLNSLALLPDGALPVFYTDDDLDWSRKPTFQDDPEISEDAFVLTNQNIYGTSLIYDTVSAKLLPWEAWGKHVDLEIAEVENPFVIRDAKSAEDIIGPWIAKLLALEWVPFGDELITQPGQEEVEDTRRDVHILTQIQERFVRFNLREVYIACGWNTTAKDLDSAKNNFSGAQFEMRKKEWMEQTQRTLDQAYQEQWSWSRIRIELRLVENGNIRLLDDLLPDGQDMRYLQL
jgi:hypothetical protein